MTDRQPRLLQRSEWASHPTLWKGHIEGFTLGTNVTVLFYSTEEVGRGPVWHVHPYDEVFIIRRGSRPLHRRRNPDRSRGRSDRLRPANIPHKFHNVGPGRLDTTDIHVSDRWIQTDLDDPEVTF